MNLEEIEAYADGLAETMRDAQQVGDIPARLEGLAHLAQIKRTRDLRSEWNAHVQMRETEIDAMHKAANATEAAVSWKAQEADEARRPICGYTWTWNSTVDGVHIETCTIGPDHVLFGIPRHYNQDTLQSTLLDAEPAEPTKPAVDRLHELVSYFVAGSEENLLKANTVGISVTEQTKHLAYSKAYDDAATKLQDILQEGGL